MSVATRLIDDPYYGGRHMRVIARIKDDRLKRNDKIVLKEIAGLANVKDFTGTIDVSYKQLALESDCCVTKVKESIARLVKCGYLKRESGAGFMGINRYYLTDLIWDVALGKILEEITPVINFDRIYCHARKTLGIIIPKQHIEEFENTVKISGIDERSLMEIIDAFSQTPYLKNSTKSIRRLWHLPTAIQEDKRRANQIHYAALRRGIDRMTVGREYVEKLGWQVSDEELKNWLELYQPNQKKKESILKEKQDKTEPKLADLLSKTLDLRSDPDKAEPESPDYMEPKRPTYRELGPIVAQSKERQVHLSRLKTEILKIVYVRGGDIETAMSQLRNCSDVVFLEKKIRNLGGCVPIMGSLGNYAISSNSHIS